MRQRNSDLGNGVGRDSEALPSFRREGTADLSGRRRARSKRRRGPGPETGLTFEATDDEELPAAVEPPGAAGPSTCWSKMTVRPQAASRRYGARRLQCCRDRLKRRSPSPLVLS